MDTADPVDSLEELLEIMPPIPTGTLRHVLFNILCKHIKQNRTHKHLPIYQKIEQSIGAVLKL